MSDEAFKALGDPTRREILRLLGERDRTAGEIVGQFAVSQPAISRHLAVLRAAGLVTATRAGQRVTYALEGDALGELVHALTELGGKKLKRK
jgi:DNA-binding transcriptional ArsR family regulator